MEAMIDSNKLTDTIKGGDQVCNLVVVVDSEGKPINKIIEYNNQTKEAVILKTDEKGLIMRDAFDVPIKETKVLEGSRLMFRVYEPVNKRTSDTNL